MNLNFGPRAGASLCLSAKCWLMALCAVLAISAPAAGQQRSPVEDAEALFADARRLVAEGKPEQACPRFEQSQKMDPAAGTLINLARCYALLGRTASAWAAYRAASAMSRAVGETKREDVARQQADALALELANTTIYTPQGQVPAGFEILLDGVPWTAGTAATPVDPGTHTVIARAPGFLEWSERFEVLPREQRSIHVPPLRDLKMEPVPVLPGGTTTAEHALQPAQPTRAHPSAARATASRRRSLTDGGPPPSKLRPLGVVLSGAGIVGLAAGTAFGLRARQLNAQSHEGNQCESTGCNPRGLELNHAARDAAAIATVAFVSGVTLSAAGVTLYLLGGATSTHSSVVLAISPLVTPRETSLVLRGRL